MSRYSVNGRRESIHPALADTTAEKRLVSTEKQAPWTPITRRLSNLGRTRRAIISWNLAVGAGGIKRRTTDATGFFANGPFPGGYRVPFLDGDSKSWLFRRHIIGIYYFHGSVIHGLVHGARGTDRKVGRARHLQKSTRFSSYSPRKLSSAHWMRNSATNRDLLLYLNRKWRVKDKKKPIPPNRFVRALTELFDLPCRVLSRIWMAEMNLVHSLYRVVRYA